MTYGVVIVTYNRIELLKECIEHCLNQTKPFTNIILIDNNSDDGTAEYLDDLASHNHSILVKHLPENTGGAGGFKKGLEFAATLKLDWVLIIDDDAIIDTNYIAQCDRYLLRHPDVQACSGTVYTDGKIQQNHRRQIINHLFHLETNIPLSAYSHTCFRYDLATFCGLMIKGSILNEIGFPKSEYFIWYDDSEYSMRLQPYGGITNINAAKLNHKTSLPTAEHKGFFMRMNWRTYYGHRNRLDAVKTHCSIATQIIIHMEFIFFIACGYIMSCIPKYRKQGVYITKLLKDAWHDGSKGCLGKNKKYLPD